MLHNSNDVVRNQSMTMVFNFWDQYTDQIMQIYNPPDYFGGFIINEDGTLTVCITDISEKQGTRCFQQLRVGIFYLNR